LLLFLHFSLCQRPSRQRFQCRLKTIKGCAPFQNGILCLRYVHCRTSSSRRYPLFTHSRATSIIYNMCASSTSAKNCFKPSWNCLRCFSSRLQQQSRLGVPAVGSCSRSATPESRNGHLHPADSRAVRSITIGMATELSRSSVDSWRACSQNR
jgi:hypothetical protein